jgi:hypothetical protein
MKTPLGVMILAVLAFTIGIIDTIWGLRLMGIVTFGPVESGNGVWLSGLLTLIVGIIWFAVGGALVSFQPWALMFTQIMAVFGLVSAVFAIFASGSLATGIGQAIIPGLVFWYTSRADIVEAFSTGGASRR